MKVDLSKLTKKDLEKLAIDVQKAIENHTASAKAEALKAAEAAAKKHGFSLSDLTGKSKGAKPKAQPRFRNPEDKSQTWSGRGRQPAWYKAAMEAGKSPQDLAI